MEEVQRIKELLQQDRPEAWENLPDIELYMDQVVSYLPRQSVGGKTPSMTSAMINNYVKDGLLPRANGKRYRKEHLACLTAIGLLKNVLTVKDMKLLLRSLVQEGEEQTFYETLLSGVDRTFRDVGADLPPDISEEDLAAVAMSLALCSVAYKTACEQLLAIIREKRREEDPEVIKEKEKEAAKREKAMRKAAEKEAKKAEKAEKTEGKTDEPSTEE